MHKTIEHIIELMPVLAVAALGGAARTIAGKNRGEAYSFRIAIPEIIIAIFAGLLTHWITSEMQIAEGYRTAAIALAGYSSRPILAILNHIFLETIRLKIGRRE